MVTVVKSLVGTGVDYAQAQVRSKSGNKLRLQIPRGNGNVVELDFAVPESVFKTVETLLAQAVNAAKPKPPYTLTSLTLEDRITNVEKFLATHFPS